jgi:hypothetical protein
MWSDAQILEATKAGIAQLVSKGYMDVDVSTITALDDHLVTDLGEALQIQDGEITNGSPVDIFHKALLSQIGKIVVNTRHYTAQLPSLYVDPVEFGLMTEQIFIDLSDVMIDEMWNPAGFIGWNEQGGPAEGARIAAIEHGCYKPAVSAKLYKKVHGVMVALTEAREQMFSAFQNAAQVSEYIAGLFTSVDNTIQLKAEVYGLMAVSMGIATAKANNNEINLLAEYKALHTGSTITAAKALEDPDFMRFALQRIAETKDNIRRFTALYNDHNMVTFASDANTILLNKFSNAAKFGVRANTYNEQLLGIGDYDKVSAWQAATSSADATPYNFGAASSISLTADAAEAAGIEVAEGATSYDITGVIGVIYDRYAMGVSIDRKKVTSTYTAARDTVNYFHHSLMQYWVNSAYPIVSFVIRDAA